MNIDEMREHEWTVSWSGGKDSTATIILMHEHNIPIKEIFHVELMYDDNIPATLPIMTNFIDQASKTFTDWGYHVTSVQASESLLDLASKIYKRSKHTERNGHQYGVMCTMRFQCQMSQVKIKTLDQLNKLVGNSYQMRGYAADEADRIHRLTDMKQSILVELGIKESDVFDICRKYNLLSPLYDLGIKRDGCWFCPNASKSERAMLKAKYPDLVKKIYSIIEMSNYLTHQELSHYSKRNNWIGEYLKEV